MQNYITIETIEELLKEKRQILLKKYRVKKIGVFGSFTRKKENAHSDIDLLVEFEEGHKDFFNYIRLKFYLEELLQRKVDLIIKDAVKSRLKEKIFSEVKYI